LATSASVCQMASVGRVLGMAEDVAKVDVDEVAGRS
jgi:hypothetical protein